MTCIGTSFDEIEKIADDYWNTGVRHLVALRGDVPIENQKNKHNDFLYATDLIEFLKKNIILKLLFLHIQRNTQIQNLLSKNMMF